MQTITNLYIKMFGNDQVWLPYSDCYYGNNDKPNFYIMQFAWIEFNLTHSECETLGKA